MVRLIQDQQAPDAGFPQPLAHRVRIGGVDKQVVRHQEAAVRAPRIHSEAPLPGASSTRRPGRGSRTPARSGLRVRHATAPASTAGRATTMVLALRRNSNSLAISPASIVLPKPVSSAISRFTLGRRNAFLRGSIWYASMVIPARNGAWNSLGSVAVVQFQRNV